MPLKSPWNNEAAAVLWCGGEAVPRTISLLPIWAQSCFCLHWSLNVPFGTSLLQGPQVHFPGGLDVRLPASGEVHPQSRGVAIPCWVLCVRLSERPC